jgi:hypothetical protein
MTISIRDPAPHAQELRPGAVVSLHSVLGDAGILQGPTEIIFCVVSAVEGNSRLPEEIIEVPRPNGRDPNEFRFYALPECVLLAGDPADRLDSSVGYPRATNEAALCHWLYLALAGNWRLPSPESDVEDLDRDRLWRLAAAVGIEDEMRDWVAEAEWYAENVPDYCEGLGI